MADVELTSKLESIQADPDTSPADLSRAVIEANALKLAVLVVPSGFVKSVSASEIPVAALIGFPHGTSKPVIKAIEATGALKDGASRVYLVPNLSNLIRRDVDATKRELMEIVRAARATRSDVFISVVLEAALLIERAEAEKTIADACRSVRESGCDGVCSSTGFDPAGGATTDLIKLLRASSDGLVLTASGMIDTAAAAKQLLDAGADRICSYAASAIVGVEEGSTMEPRRHGGQPG